MTDFMNCLSNLRNFNTSCRTFHSILKDIRDNIGGVIANFRHNKIYYLNLCIQIHKMGRKSPIYSLPGQKDMIMKSSPAGIFDNINFIDYT